MEFSKSINTALQDKTGWWEDYIWKCMGSVFGIKCICVLPKFVSSNFNFQCDDIGDVAFSSYLALDEVI